MVAPSDASVCVGPERVLLTGARSKDGSFQVVHCNSTEL